MKMENINRKIEMLEWQLMYNSDLYSGTALANKLEEYHSLKHIRDLWDEFGAILMNEETECIEVEWHGFPAGTFREEIWEWFESQFNISVVDLMYDHPMHTITLSEMLRKDNWEFNIIPLSSNLARELIKTKQIYYLSYGEPTPISECYEIHDGRMYGIENNRQDLYEWLLSVLSNNYINEISFNQEVRRIWIDPDTNDAIWGSLRDIEDLACALKSRHYHVDTCIYGQEYAHLVAKKEK